MADKRSIERKVYPHELLWRSASSLLRRAEAEQTTSYHLLLPALLMSYLAYEAFVDFCGATRLPKKWQEEKKHFGRPGIEGKLKALAKHTPGFEWCKGERPCQRIKQLGIFRDRVVHAKVWVTWYDADPSDDFD